MNKQNKQSQKETEKIVMLREHVVSHKLCHVEQWLMRDFQQNEAFKETSFFSFNYQRKSPVLL